MNRSGMKQICGDCLHYYACAAWNIGSLANTEAGSCVNYTPAADVVEVVRCKKCELWSSCLSKQEKQVLIDTNTDGVCEYWMSDGLMPNDFCSYGKRKEGQR